MEEDILRITDRDEDGDIQVVNNKKCFRDDAITLRAAMEIERDTPLTEEPYVTEHVHDGYC